MSDTPSYADWPDPPTGPTQPSSGISNRRLFTMLVGLSVLVGGGFLGAMVVSGGGDGPTKAVDRFFEAAADEDLLGMMAAIDPEERQALEPGVVGLADQLRRLGVASDDLALDGLAGVDIELSDLVYETEALTDDLVTVRVVSGTAVTSANPADLPLGDALDEFGVEPPDEPDTETIDLAQEDVALVAVRRDDRWWVSLGFSIADAARREEGMPFPQPEDWLSPAGAETPEGVADLLASAIEDLSLGAFLTLLPPGEADPLHAFGPAWVDAADSLTTDLRRNIGLELDIEFQTAAETDGDRAHLTFTGFSMVGSVDGEALGEGPGRVTFELSAIDDCATFDIRLPDGSPFPLDDFLGAAAPFPLELLTLGETVCDGDLPDEDPSVFGSGSILDDLPIDPAGLTGIGLELRQEDDLWYLSPTASVLDVFVRLLSAFDDDAISWFAANVDALLAEILGPLTDPTGFEIDSEALAA